MRRGSRMSGGWMIEANDEGRSRTNGDQVIEANVKGGVS